MNVKKPYPARYGVLFFISIGIVEVRMTECNKKSSIGDCKDCNVELCKNICYERYAKLFDDKYKGHDNEPELTNSKRNH